MSIAWTRVVDWEALELCLCSWNELRKSVLNVLLRYLHTRQVDQEESIFDQDSCARKDGNESEGSISFPSYGLDIVVFSFAFRCRTSIE